MGTPTEISWAFQGCRDPCASCHPPTSPFQSIRAWDVSTGLCTPTSWHPLKVHSGAKGESSHLIPHFLSSTDAEKVALSAWKVEGGPSLLSASTWACRAPRVPRLEEVGGPGRAWEDLCLACQGPSPQHWVGKARSALDFEIGWAGVWGWGLA